MKIIYCFLFILLSSFALAAISTTDTLSYLTFDNSDLNGSNPVDVSGNGRHGTNTLADTGVLGVIDESFRFSGSGWVSLSNMGMWENHGAVSLWFNQSTPDTFEYFLAQSPGSSPQWYIASGSGANNGNVGFYENFGASHFVYTNSAYNDNNWHHLVVNKNGTSLTLWVDNNPDANLTVAASFFLTRIVEIGSRAGGTQGNLKGRIDEIWFINRTLSRGEIAELYNGGSGFQYPFIPLALDVDLWVKNDSGINKSTYKEGEPFKLTANFSYNNGSLITGGLCNFSIPSGITEYKAPDTNFSLCSSCDYSNYQTLLSSLSPGNNATDRDYIRFDVCNTQIPKGSISVSFRCGVRSFQKVISDYKIPLCSDGVSRVLVSSGLCVNESNVNISVSFDGVGSRQKIILNLTLDREFSDLNINGTFNVSSNLFYSPRKFKYFTHGNPGVSVNCTVSGSSVKTSQPLTLENSPPLIFFNYIFMPGSIQDLNGSSLQYFGGVWNFSVSVVDDDIDLIGLNFSNSSKVFNTFSSDPFNVSASFFRDFLFNPFKLKVWVNDTSGAVVNKTLNFNVSDTINPFCSGLADITVFSTGDYVFNWSAVCMDKSFFSFNISCDNGFNFSKDGMNQETFTFLNTTTINASVICSYSYCDGHTANKLNREWFVRPFDDYIEFQVNTHIHTLRSLDGGSINYIQQPGRINFVVNLSRISPLGANFQYTTSPDAFYFPSQVYPGWIVDAKSRTWFDMSQEFPDFKVSVVRWNYTTWNVKVIPPTNFNTNDPVSLRFHSIGELNCVSGTQAITLRSPIVKYKYSVIRPPLTVALVLVLFLLFLVWFAFVSATFWLEGPHGHTVQLFNLGQLVLGVLLLIYVFKTFNGLLALVVGLVSLGIFISKAIAQN